MPSFLGFGTVCVSSARVGSKAAFGKDATLLPRHCAANLLCERLYQQYRAFWALYVLRFFGGEEDISMRAAAKRAGGTLNAAVQTSCWLVAGARFVALVHGGAGQLTRHRLFGAASW